MSVEWDIEFFALASLRRAAHQIKSWLQQNGRRSVSTTHQKSLLKHVLAQNINSSMSYPVSVTSPPRLLPPLETQ
jgi:hypothetical protein